MISVTVTCHIPDQKSKSTTFQIEENDKAYIGISMQHETDNMVYSEYHTYALPIIEIDKWKQIE